MRLVCHLRKLRGERSLRDVAAELGMSRGLLSEIERGRRLPPDEWIRPLEEIYGAKACTWYRPEALLAIQHDQERGE